MLQNNSRGFDENSTNRLLKRLEKLLSAIEGGTGLYKLRNSNPESATPQKNKEQWVNLNGASDYTSLSIPKLRRAVSSGELKASKRGGRLLFKIDWLDSWLTS